MADQVKLYKYDPQTHKFSDDFSNTNPTDCYAIAKTKDTCDKTKDVLTNIQLFCPAAYTLPNIHNNPVIEVKPNITVHTGSSSLLPGKLPNGHPRIHGNAESHRGSRCGRVTQYVG